jgi:UDP-N-acetylmuramoyl-tripeptide--D-alanyl-D-alanine ligase
MNVEEIYRIYKQTGMVSTDTRQITPGSVFFAIKGPRFNANEFAQEALAKGAAAAVVDEEKFCGQNCFLVNDGLDALQQLARHHRSHLKIPILALTGSNGKTTSKELVNAVLSCKFRTYSTKGNLNNHIGVPLTILSIDSSVQIAVVEMGANHLGEIAALCNIAHPTHGFITNIGKAHIGTFGGFENIIRAKSELFQYLISTNGKVFINSANPILFNMARRFKEPVLYPQPGDYYSCTIAGMDPFLSVNAENGELVRTQLTGAYNFENVAAALCVGKFFDVPPDAANKAIETYAPSNMRSQVVQKGTNTIILDAYNANPSSMAAAIENMAAINARTKVLILGDMYELEEEASKEHAAIGRLIKEKGFQQVYLCGELFAAALEYLPRAKHFLKKDQLLAELKDNPPHNSTILVKASRGIGLEATMDVL